MKYLQYALVTFVVGLILYFGFFGTRPGSTKNPGIELPADAVVAAWETKTDEQPPVNITVTPVQLGRDADVWKFDIAFDTHAGSLDHDPMNVVTLLDDKCGVYRPTAWEGPEPGGHHREGALRFNAIRPVPPYVELMVKNVGGIPERSFTWNMK